MTATAAPEAVRAYFAPCPRGLEQVLAEELRGLGALAVSATAGGVAFEGDRALGYAANLHSRIASRVLVRLASGRYRGDDDLYRLARSVPWTETIDRQATLRVDTSAIRSLLRSLNFATLRIKDGIVDALRDATGERPDIDTRNPGTRVFGFLEDRQATLYLDLSGESLFKRGWRSSREDKGEAPLKENLAAGLVALSGWTAERPFYDPFCGSGTIVIEAAQRALDIAPGLSRHFAFERLPDFDAATWTALRSDAMRRMHAASSGAALRIAASDVDGRAVEQLRANARRAGLPDGLVECFQSDLGQARAPFDAAGVIVSNPPYGERLELAGGRTGWRGIGQALRERFGGWTVCLLSSDRDLPRWLGMKERRKTPLYNGAIECRLFAFEVFAAGPVQHPQAGDGDAATVPDATRSET